MTIAALNLFLLFALVRFCVVSLEYLVHRSFKRDGAFFLKFHQRLIETCILFFDAQGLY